MKLAIPIAIVAGLVALVYGASLLAAVGTAIAAVLIVALLAWSLSEPMDPVYRHDADCDCPACVKRGVPL